MKKYKLLKKEFIIHEGIKLYRIMALTYINNPHKIIVPGDRGGWISSEDNLSQIGPCWIFDEAKVYGHTVVNEEACIAGNVEAYGNARLRGSSLSIDNAIIRDDCIIKGHAIVDAAAVVGEDIVLNSGTTSVDLTQNKNLEICIRNSLNVVPHNGKYIFYKRVNRGIEAGTYHSLYYNTFIYKMGQIVKLTKKECEYSTEGCAPGLHVSHANYWHSGNTLLIVEVQLKDIITCQSEKVRCRKLKVIGEYSC